MHWPFLGYSMEQKGYQLQDEKTMKIISSRDVAFVEVLLPKKQLIAHDVIESKGEHPHIDLHMSQTMLPMNQEAIPAKDTVEQAPTDPDPLVEDAPNAEQPPSTFVTNDTNVEPSIAPTPAKS